MRRGKGEEGLSLSLFLFLPSYLFSLPPSRPYIVEAGATRMGEGGEGGHSRGERKRERTGGSADALYM